MKTELAPDPNSKSVFFVFSTNLVFPDYGSVSSDGGPHILVSIQGGI